MQMMNDFNSIYPSSLLIAFSTPSLLLLLQLHLHLLLLLLIVFHRAKYILCSFYLIFILRFIFIKGIISRYIASTK